MMQTYNKEICGACGGRGWQYNQLSGMNEKCPVCDGSGVRWKSNMSELPPGTYCYNGTTSGPIDTNNIKTCFNNTDCDCGLNHSTLVKNLKIVSADHGEMKTDYIYTVRCDG